MTDNRQDSAQDLLGIIEHLVDNLQESNAANTEILHSVNVSLIKVSETLPELKGVSAKVEKLNTEKIMDEVRIISNNLKTILVIAGVLISLGLFIIGLLQFKSETMIVQGVATQTEKIFDDHIRVIEDKIKILEERKK